MGQTITPNELKRKSSEVTVIDVRRKGEYDGETILNAKWYDPEQVSQWVKDLPADKEVVLYCARGGSVSKRVLDYLLNESINARFIEGGIEGVEERWG